MEKPLRHEGPAALSRHRMGPAARNGPGRAHRRRAVQRGSV